MSDEDTPVKEIVFPSPEEVLGDWAKLVEDLRASKVCYCPGQNRGREPQFEDFIAAMPLVGECDWLVYAEPIRSKSEVCNACCRLPPIRVEGGCVTSLNLVESRALGGQPDLDRQSLFWVPTNPWLPHDEQPANDRFWGNYVRVRFLPANETKERLIHVVQIGIGGLAGALYFFQPHRIEVIKTIEPPA